MQSSATLKAAPVAAGPVRPATGAGAGDEQPNAEARAAADVVLEIVKSRKAARLYEPSNRIVTMRLARLMELLEAYLEDRGPLHLAIYPFELRWNSHAVYRDDTRESSLPFRLYADGLRGLTFRAEVTAASIRQLIEVFNTEPPRDDHAEDDVVTLLWELNLEGIEYELADDVVAATGAGAGLDAFLTADDAPSPLADSLPAATPADEVAAEDLDALEKPASLPTESVNLSPAEAASLAEELRREGDRDRLVEIQDVLFETSALSADPDERARLAEVACAMHNSILESMPDHRALRVLVRVAVLSEFYFTDPGPACDLAQHLADNLARADNVARLRAIAEGVPPSEFADLIRVVRRLPDAATPALVQAIADSRLKSVRSLFSDLVVARGELALPLIERVLANTTGAPAPDLLDAAIRLDGGVGLVIRAAGHADAEVRRSAVRLLAERAPAAALAVFLERLEDADARVRGTAILALSATGGRDQAVTLCARIERPEFHDLSGDEQRALLLCYGRLAGDAGVSTLRSMLLSKNWFGRSRNLASSMAAAEALTRLDCMPARAVLTEASRIGAREVRDHCKALLVRIGTAES